MLGKPAFLPSRLPSSKWSSPGGRATYSRLAGTSFDLALLLSCIQKFLDLGPLFWDDMCRPLRAINEDIVPESNHVERPDAGVLLTAPLGAETVTHVMPPETASSENGE